MSRRPASFRQSDVTRAIQGARAAGESVRQIEIDSSGKIILIVGESAKRPTVESLQSWDSVS
jgi:hypothetical protein